MPSSCTVGDIKASPIPAPESSFLPQQTTATNNIQSNINIQRAFGGWEAHEQVVMNIHERRWEKAQKFSKARTVQGDKDLHGKGA